MVGGLLPNLQRPDQGRVAYASVNSIVDRLDRDIYPVLEDFRQGPRVARDGRAGQSLALIDDLRSGQYD